MNFKKRVNGSWTDVPHYISGTDTETITTLPATIYPLAQSVTIGLKGNTTQNGTPTPDNPVPVVGVGDLDNGNYKIPISSAGQTNNIYLGEVQSTRKIKKLVLDGTENWTYSASGGKKRVFTSGFDDKALTSTAKCTHFVASETYVSYPDSGTMVINFASATQSMVFGVTDMTISSADDFKAYLAQQYAAGTPVCVWYVLANEKTAVVNEPLMKIGDYADSISGISVTTTAGANTLDVDTTVKPSEVTANFNGWHPVSAAHERENGAWT